MEHNYLCINCKKEFDEPYQLREPDGLDTPPYRYTDCCPRCHCDDILEAANECQCCGKTIWQSEECYVLIESDEYFCEQCIIEKTADKNYKCHECSEVIEKEETYYMIDSFDDKYCQNCMEKHTA